MKKNYMLIILTIILILGLTGCQSSELEDKLNQLSNKTSKLEDQINELNTENDSLKKEISEYKIQKEETESKKVISEDQTKELLMSKSSKLIELLKDCKYEEVLSYSHPSYGLRFSPYHDMNYMNVTLFKGTKYDSSTESNNIDYNSKYTWGIYDGSGFLIMLIIKQHQ